MKSLLSLLVVLVFAPSASAARGDLVSSRLKHRVTGAEAAAIAYPYGKIDSPHAVEIYELVYRTLDGKGNEVTASGAVAVPVGAVSAPVVSIQHGTVFDKNAVPSRLPAYWMGGALLFAASGYVTVMPDYVGYGVSAGSFHPYLHARSLAASVVDLLLATRRFVSGKSILINSRLFLLGYSEGGYATLAAHREIEERHSPDLVVTASAPMGGPYDLKVTMDVLMQRRSPGSIPYLAFAFWAYDRIYGLNGLKGIFREPYRSRVVRMFGLSRSGDEVNTALPSSASELFVPAFIAAWRGEGARRVKEAARENSLINWKPAAPVALFHCTNDTVVPVENAVEAHAAFSGRGASDVRLIERDLGDHSTCYAPLLAEAKAFFDSFRTGKPQ